jgi:transcriptional regulator with PAS, ATPase and Fis domain
MFNSDVGESGTEKDLIARYIHQHIDRDNLYRFLVRAAGG